MTDSKPETFKPMSQVCVLGYHEACDGRTFAGMDCTCNCHKEEPDPQGYDPTDAGWRRKQ